MVSWRSKHKIKISDFFKNIKNDKRLFRILIICIAITLLCFILCVYHVKQITHVYKDSITDDITSALGITAGELEKDFYARGQFLEAAGSTIGRFTNPGREEIAAALAVAENSDNFDSVVFVKRGNSVRYKADGTTTSVMISEYEAVIDDDSAEVSVFRNFAAEGREEISFGIPVKSEGVSIGYLVGSVSASEFFENACTISESAHADVLLCDSFGQILSRGDEKAFVNVRGINFFTDFLSELTGDELEAASLAETIHQNNFSEDIYSIESESSGGEGLTILWSTIGSTGWMVVSILGYNELVAVLMPLLIETLITMASMVAIVVLMIVIMSVYVSGEQNRIHELSFVDTLTDAPNEAAFKLQTKKNLKENPDTPYMLACFDIANFRYINESYGHDKADMILKTMASAMLESLTLKEAFARIGADRFVALVLDDGREEECVAFVHKKLSDAAAELLMNYPIRIKAGIYYVTDIDEPIDDMMDKANLARKAISSESHGSLLRQEYQDSLSDATRKQEMIESCMDSALYNREFVPFLQPKWDMENNHICGAEALIRWRRSDGSLVPPGEFIPLFEKNGFIEKIDFFMLDSICAYLRRMIDENRDVYPVSINQSRYLMYNPEYLSKVQEILLKYRIPKGLVELELTETVFFHEKERMLEVMKRLKEFNMELSIDDFGSGYSSLNLLRDIPFDVLKIDRGFLDESSQSESGKWILRKIVEMAEGLKLKVICEGVETKEHVDMLLDIGCKYAQGFLYSRPIPLEEFIEKYNTVREYGWE